MRLLFFISLLLTIATFNCIAQSDSKGTKVGSRKEYANVQFIRAEDYSNRLVKYTREKRLAVILGAINYRRYGDLSKNTNGGNDVDSMVNAMIDLNFDIVCVRDGTLDDFKNALDLAKDLLHEIPYETGVAYFTGHGVMAGGVQEFLLPRDYRLAPDTNEYVRLKWISNRSITLDQLLAVMTDDRNATKMQKILAIKDACSDAGKSDDVSEEDVSAVIDGGQKISELLNKRSNIIVRPSPGHTSSMNKQGTNSMITSKLLPLLRSSEDDVKGIVDKLTKLLADEQDLWLTGQQYGFNFYLNPNVSKDTSKKTPPIPAPRKFVDLKEREIPTTSPCPLTAMEAALEIEATMVNVAGGTYMMGCTSEQGGQCGGDEKLAHSETVGKFRMNKYEVTQAQYRAIMGGDTPLDWKTWDSPQTSVSHADAVKFCEELSLLLNKNYRLPCEAEWEWAARGGEYREGTTYAGSNDIDEVAWYNRSGAMPVGRVKKPNALGLYDMSGNVWEWCSDRYSNDYNSPRNSSYFCLRGGSWRNTARYCRVSNRNRSTNGNYYYGFRLAASP